MSIQAQGPFIQTLHTNLFLSTFLHGGKTAQDLKNDRCLIKEVEDNGISKFLNDRIRDF